MGHRAPDQYSGSTGDSNFPLLVLVGRSFSFFSASSSSSSCVVAEKAQESASTRRHKNSMKAVGELRVRVPNTMRDKQTPMAWTEGGVDGVN